MLIDSKLFRLLFLAVLIGLAGCAAHSVVYHSSDAQAPPVETSLLILPADVVVSRFTAGGIEEPRADWTESVSSTLTDALHTHLYEQGTQFVEYGEDLHDQDVGVIRQLNTLADAIELSQAAPNIGGARVYQLGSAETARLQEFGTDYALLVVLKANRATGGRVATAVLASFAGAAIETNSAQFRSLLVDVRDGHVKWANFDRQALTEIGDPIKAREDKWRKAVDHLLSEFPL